MSRASRTAPLLLGLALAAGSAWPRCVLRTLEVPVTFQGLRPVVQVVLDDQPASLLLDTGAFYSMVTETAATQLGLKPYRAPYGLRVEGIAGRVAVRAARVQRMALQGTRLEDIEFLVGGNQIGGGIQGLLGRNLLNWADTEFDLPSGKLRFVRPAGDCAPVSLAYWAGSAPVSEVELRGDHRDPVRHILADATIDGQRVRAMFDTGATSILSLRSARRIGLVRDTAGLEDAGRVSGAGAGELPSWWVPMPSFEMGGQKIANARIRVADFELDDADLLIGIDFFLSHRVYVAWSQRRMLFTYQGGPVFDMRMKAAPSDQQAADAQAPTDAAGFAQRGAARLARGQLHEALADLDRACELAPTVASHFLLRGRVHRAMGDAAGARRNLDEAVRLDPRDAHARLERAFVAHDRQDVAVALDDLSLLDRTLPANADARRTMGRLFAQLEQPDAAIAQYDAWLAAHPDDVDRPILFNERCWMRARGGRELDLALKDCNAALDGRPDDANFLDSRALVHLRSGRWREALADYDRALQRNPKLAWSLYGRALVRQRLGDGDAAAADLAAARALDATIEDRARRAGLAADR